MAKIFCFAILNDAGLVEIVPARSRKDAINRATKQGLINQHEDYEIALVSQNDLTKISEIFAVEARISDRQLCLKALQGIWTPEAEKMEQYLQGSEIPSILKLILDLFRDQSVSLEERYGYWCALAFALARYTPSVQRDRVLKDVEAEVEFLQSEIRYELRNEFLASMEDEIEEMEEFCNAA